MLRRVLVLVRIGQRLLVGSPRRIGLAHRRLPVFSVQYHPEAAAGPHDAKHLFQRFMKLMDR
jgi:carbamoylphosphate synthase small subunit